MTFDEAVQAVLAQPGISFTGIGLTADGDRLAVYTVSTVTDEPDWIDIAYEGGRLFSTSGEEDNFDLEDVPAEAKQLAYNPSADLPDLGWLTSEHSLLKLFPELPDPETLWEREDRIRFRHQALAAAAASTIVTVLGV